MSVSLSDVRAELLRMAGDLRPTLFKQQIDYYLRGGLPAQSMGAEIRGGIGDSDGFDKPDQWLQRKRTAHREALEQAEKALRLALNIERAVIVQVHIATHAESLKAAEEVSRQAEPCADCGRVVERTRADPMREGRCSACAMKRYRAGEGEVVSA